MRQPSSPFFGIVVLLMSASVVLPTVGGATLILTDPAGDATSPGPLNPGPYPDLLSLSAGYDSTMLYVTALFSPGTMLPSNLFFNVALNTDLNPTTGSNWGTFDGADQVLGFPDVHLWGAPKGQVCHFGYGFVCGFTESDHFLIAFGTDSFSLAVPLSALGNDDGVAYVGMGVGVPVGGPLGIYTDDIGLCLAGPTTAIPAASVREPSTLVLLGAGFAGVGVVAWRLRRRG